MCVAQLKRRKPGGIWYANDNIAEKKAVGIRYVYGHVGEGENWRNMVCVWQRWVEKKLEEHRMCMAPLERGQAGGIWYVYCNVGEGKTWRNTVCVW